MADQQPRYTWPAVLRILLDGGDLTADQAAWAMGEILSDSATSAQIAGFAIALRQKGETVEELDGLVRTLYEHAVTIAVSGRTVDVVGTGGDGAHTVNLSTMSAIVAAAAGVKVVKHGNRSASSLCGAADLVESLGVPLDLPPEQVARIAEDVGITFCFAPAFHPALRFAGPTRRELGVPTAFNVIGPLANPARPAAQAVGVADARMAGLVAGVLATRGIDALVFRGDDGLDELTTSTTSRVWVVREGAVTEEILDPRELGLPRSPVEALRGGDAEFNTRVCHQVLGGERGPVRDAVLLNSAATLAIHEPGTSGQSLLESMRAGLERATEAIDSGAAAALLDRWVKAAQS
ncbi:MAG TPA: anthranilate phosphoribosyltransferase [Actinopolymorphaceae bacterium]